MDLEGLLSSQTQDLCFWRSEKYQVYENQAATVLGPLGPAYLRKRCPHYSVSYSITNGKYNSPCNALSK